MTFINNKLPIGELSPFININSSSEENSIKTIGYEILLGEELGSDLPTPILDKAINTIDIPGEIYDEYTLDNSVTELIKIFKESPGSLLGAVFGYGNLWENIEGQIYSEFEEIDFEKEEEHLFTINDLNDENAEKLGNTKNAYQLAHMGKKLFVTGDFGEMNSILTATLEHLGKSNKLYYFDGNQFIELTDRQLEIASKVILRLISIKLFKPKFIVQFIQELYRQEKKELKKDKENFIIDNNRSDVNTTKNIKTSLVSTLHKNVVKALSIVSFIISQKAIEELRIREHRKNERERDQRNREYDHKMEKRKDYENRIEYTKQHERLLNKERTIKKSQTHSARKV